MQRAPAVALMQILRHECEHPTGMTNAIEVFGALLPKKPQVEGATGARPICLLPGLLNTACNVMLVSH